ncbi:hypothetical protein [Actinoplanes sp. L3-i22]|uniref:hypothetical protein n=1 Tax=Actinoplanes sp. L3-i22 TaxID=2836373 RepID=UPI001C76BA94|nr:hypothetical protein [Actinoplanes sp. L3-i22]BCY05879.1 hypothetical protein L3i22_009670 [Actinoplanes sp. L3-i22]
MLESALVALLLASPASGTITFTPANSIDLASIKVHTSGGCPAPADGFYAVARGHGFPKDGQVVTAPTAAGMSATGGFDVYFGQTMADFAADNHTELSGQYDVTVSCVDSFKGTVFAEYTGALTFTSPKTYKSGTLSAGTTASPAPSAAAVIEPVPETVTEAAPPPPAPAKPSLWWLVAGLAAVLLAFEAGRRFGRRTRTP